ncbi:hypothetical protein Anas_05497 [Armadillidium nasatum]|uniref:Uncharacterized protein n=1 Tax=Armadillidium nasatum TaxID=96803 RepID=A0A5N5THC6_9CRUS|nr:hypothetical protein Anas_05497 [Armadillidium nasatum]
MVKLGHLCLRVIKLDLKIIGFQNIIHLNFIDSDVLQKNLILIIHFGRSSFHYAVKQNTIFQSCTSSAERKVHMISDSSVSDLKPFYLVSAFPIHSPLLYLRKMSNMAATSSCLEFLTTLLVSQIINTSTSGPQITYHLFHLIMLK